MHTQHSNTALNKSDTTDDIAVVVVVVVSTAEVVSTTGLRALVAVVILRVFTVVTKVEALTPMWSSLWWS